MEPATHSSIEDDTGILVTLSHAKTCQLASRCCVLRKSLLMEELLPRQVTLFYKQFIFAADALS